MVRSVHVRTHFDSTQSQESKSDIGLRNRPATKTHIRTCISGVGGPMTPFFASTESQEFKSDMNFAQQYALRFKIHLGNAQY